MRRSLFAMFVLGMSWGDSSVWASTPEYDPYSLVVTFAPSIDGKALAEELKSAKGVPPAGFAPLAGVSIESLTPVFPIPPNGLRDALAYDSLRMAQVYVATIADVTSFPAALSLLKSSLEIEYVGMNHIGRMDGSSISPSDPLYTTAQWHYRAIQLPQAWDITTGNNGVIIGVIDSGIDLAHPDLANHVALNTIEWVGFQFIDDDGNGYVDDYFGWDFISSDGSPDDSFLNGHGTHVSGTIGAVTNNGLDVAGVNWNVTLLPAKVFDAAGNGGTETRIAQATYFLVNNGVWAINMSLGIPPNQTMAIALDYAYAASVPVIASMGNDNEISDQYPSSHPATLAVGATDSLDRRWEWNDSSGSNFGPTIGVTAPGDVIMSTKPSIFEYGAFTGTSMATPHVTGLAGLILSVRPTVSVDSIYWYIALGAEDMVGDPSEDILGPDIYYGYGRINAYNSIRLALGQCVCKCFGDPRCDGLPNIQDVVATVNAAFRGDAPTIDFGCPRERTDVTGNGFTNIQDVVAVVNVVFRGGTVEEFYGDPCQ